MSALYEGEGWTMRRATPADNDRLCELFRTIHMKGKLDVTQEREPDFFALGRMHPGRTETFAFVDASGSVEGCGSVSLRDGLLGGERVPTGYMCDLRLSPKLRGGGVLAAASRAFMRYARETYGTEILYDVVFDTNAPARGALVRRTDKRRDVAVHTPMTPFDMVSVQMTTPKGRPARAIRRATEADVPALVEHLQRDHQSRALGYLVDEALLRDRFRDWPGFSIESFFLSHDRHGRLDGCVAPWDTRAFKRTRVLGYHGEMRFVRAAFDVVARVRRFRPLPAPGQCFDFSFLTHLAVANDDPAVLRDLLLAVYAELRPTGAHFMSAMVPRGSSLAPAFRGFQLQKTAMTLYTVTDPSSRWATTSLATLRPGFEMALS